MESILTRPFPKGLYGLFGPGVNEVLLNANRSLQIRLSDGSCKNELINEAIENAVLTRAIQEFSLNQGIRLDPLQPYAGGDCFIAELGHFRWHAVIPPISPEGPLFCFRRHGFEKHDLKSFGQWERYATLILEAMSLKRPIFIVGPTGCGKTTFLVALLLELAASERVVILERVAEIPLLSPQWIRLVGREKQRQGDGSISVDMLLEESLRLRPDRLVVSEVRGQEVDGLFQAMHAGHGGVMTTFHADSATGLLARLKTSGKADAADWEALFRELHPLMIIMRRDRPSCIDDVLQLGG